MGLPEDTKSRPEALATEFFCKTCGKRKGDAEGWLLAFEGSGKPGRVMKYTINVLNKWDDERAQQRNAIHFCSAECKNKYVWQSYGDDTWET